MGSGVDRKLLASEDYIIQYIRLYKFTTSCGQRIDTFLFMYNYIIKFVEQSS